MSASIAVLVGHLRAGSGNRRIAEAALDLATDDIGIDIYEGLGDLPFYNEDCDGDVSHPAVARFREMVDHADAVLVVTGEHNGTITAVLKNAIDWGSRPYGTSALWDKPVAVVGGAWGQYGGVWAQDEARKALGLAGARIVDEARLSVPMSHERFADIHPREDAEVRNQLAAVIRALVAGPSNRKVTAQE